MTPSKTLAPAGALPNWMRALPLEELGQLAVPMAVLGHRHRADHAAAGVRARPAGGHRHPDVGHRADGLALSRAARWSSASFPTTLLLLTLFRLSLNISSSRLILLNGNTGTSAAGEVIGAFGSFVVGGNYVIGAVIFLVLDRHPVRRHQSRRGAHLGSHRALHSRCPAGQADVDRFRSECRADRRDGGQAPPQATGHRSRVLRRHGRRVALHAARCGGQHSDHRHQHHRRIPDRRAAARHGVSARRSRPTRC